MSVIRPEYYVDLKGKKYPLYGGVLIAATEAGLQSLTTELIQIPNDANGQMAIVRATATFADGRVYSDYGDASPRNTSTMIAAAAIRMASTRAKGRALRDAIGLGETLREELGDDEPQIHPSAAPREAAPPREAPAGDNFCQSCGLEMTGAQVTFAQTKFQKTLCPQCQRKP